MVRSIFFLHFLLFLSAIIMFCTPFSFGQSRRNTDKFIYIIDFEAGKPVKNVYVYDTNYTETTLSGNYGEVNIKNFKPTDTICFKHPSYQYFTLIKSEIKDTVFLHLAHILIEDVDIVTRNWRRSFSDVSNKVSIIRRKDIEMSNSQTSADLLSASGKVFVQKSQMGGGSPMLRGFAANSVLLVFDGVRMNNAIYRSGNLQNVISIDVNSVEQAEVIFGPGAVVYGSDALGGVMSFQSLTTSQNFKVSALTRYSSANKEKTANIKLYAGNARLEYVSSITYSNFDDLRMGRNIGSAYTDIAKRQHYVLRNQQGDSVYLNKNPYIQRFTGFEQVSMLQKLKWNISPNKDLKLTVYYNFTDTVPRYDRLTEYSQSLPKYATWDYCPQWWLFHSVQYSDSTGNSMYNSMNINASYQFYNESRNDRRLNSNRLRILNDELHALSLYSDFQKDITHQFLLNYGSEVVMNWVESTGAMHNILNGETSKEASRYPAQSQSYSMAAYLFSKYIISDKFNLKAGVRYSFVMLNSDFSDKTFYDFPFDVLELKTGALNGSFGLTWFASQKVAFYSTLSSGFRTPNLDDIAKMYDSQPGVVVVPNNNLKPEYVYNIDFKLLTRSTIIETEISMFYSFLNNAMVRRDFTFNGEDSIMYAGEMSKVQAVVNATSAQIYGLSVFSKYRINHFLSIESTASYLKGYDSDNIPLRHIPPLFGSTKLQAKWSKWYIELSSDYNSEKPFSEFNPSEAEKTSMYAKDKNGNPFTPAWVTANVRLSLNLGKLNLSSGCDNIFDVYYRTYSSGVSAPGRNIYFSLSFNR